MAANNDDENWTRALTGRPPDGADPATLAEAKALREAILKVKPADPAADSDVESGLQRLLFRLRQEGLAQRRTAMRPQAWMALAASALLAVGVATMMHEGLETAVQPLPQESPMRSRSLERPQIVFTENVAQAAAALKRDLESLGLTPTVTEGEDAVRIETAWPADAGERHRALLERHYLPLPESGTLRVEVRRRP